MSQLFAAGRDLQKFFEQRGWRFCFIGGLAVLRWGQPRLTRDVDVGLLCPFGSDIALAALPYEEQVIERSSLFEFEPGSVLRTCSAEDLVATHLAPLAEIKGQPEIMGILNRFSS